MRDKTHRWGHVTPPAIGSYQHDYRIARLIGRLPARVQRIIRWLRRPSSRWIRIPASVLLIAGAFLSILPVFGLWMLPLGLVLLAEDLPPLRRARTRMLDWIERRRPHWFDPPRVSAQPGRRLCRLSAGGARKGSSGCGRPLGQAFE